MIEQAFDQCQAIFKFGRRATQVADVLTLLNVFAYYDNHISYRRYTRGLFKIRQTDNRHCVYLSNYNFHFHRSRLIDYRDIVQFAKYNTDKFQVFKRRGKYYTSRQMISKMYVGFLICTVQRTAFVSDYLDKEFKYFSLNEADKPRKLEAYEIDPL